jgi:hypothetical protein
MGISEEGGKVITGTVDALKAQPLALALVIINVLFLFGGVWGAHDFLGRLEKATQRKDDLIAEMTKRCFDMRDKVEDRDRDNSK